MDENKKKIIIYIMPFLLLIITIPICILVNNNKNSTSISSLDLIKDTYITDDYINDVIYENTIYVPKEMTRLIQINKSATYVYRKEGRSFTINYASCIDDKCIESYK
jgi:hypothetical protein